MIESVMLIAIGFLWGGLAALAFMPIVHNRAVRLTQRTLEADLRPFKAEVQCHKDLLSAEFAVSMRRAEIAMERMRRRRADLMVELAKRGDAISRLKIERNALSAELGELKNKKSVTGPTTGPTTGRSTGRSTDPSWRSMMRAG